MNSDILHHAEDSLNSKRHITVALTVDHCSIDDWGPYEWKGTIDQQKVKIIQKDYPATSLEDFDFVEYPGNINLSKSYVIKLIDKYMRSMKD